MFSRAMNISDEILSRRVHKWSSTQDCSTRAPAEILTSLVDLVTAQSRDRASDIRTTGRVMMEFRHSTRGHADGVPV
jgi:hypothetical protein